MSLSIVAVAAARHELPIFASWLWLQWGARRGRTPAQSLARIAAMTGAAGLPFGFCAYWRGLPAGFACCTADDLAARPDLSPWLASVFVRPDARGHGIASALAERVAAEAKQRGFADLFLYTPDQQALYARLGWAELDSARELDHAVTVMRRAL